MKGIDNVLKRIAEYKKGRKGTASQDVVGRLRQIGMSIIREAELTRDTRNKFGNQNDAYGFCIFYDGKEVEGGRGYLDEISTRPAVIYGEKIYGRDAIDEFFDNYDEAPTGPYYTLVVANAMPYSAWQEHGQVPNVNRKIRIISQMTGSIEDYARELGGITDYHF